MPTRKLYAFEDDIDNFISRWTPKSHNETYLRKIHPILKNSKVPTLAQSILLAKDPQKKLSQQKTLEVDDPVFYKEAAELLARGADVTHEAADATATVAIGAAAMTGAGILAGKTANAGINAANDVTSNLINQLSSTPTPAKADPTPTPIMEQATNVLSSIKNGAIEVAAAIDNPERYFYEKGYGKKITPPPIVEAISDVAHGVSDAANAIKPDMSNYAFKKPMFDGSAETLSTIGDAVLEGVYPELYMYNLKGGNQVKELPAPSPPTTAPSEIPPTPVPPTPVPPTPEPTATTTDNDTTSAFYQIPEGLENVSQSKLVNSGMNFAQNLLMATLFGNREFSSVNKQFTSMSQSRVANAAEKEQKNMSTMREKLASKIESRKRKDMVNNFIQDGNKLRSVNDYNDVNSAITDISLASTRGKRQAAPDPWQLEQMSAQNQMQAELMPFGAPLAPRAAV